MNPVSQPQPDYFDQILVQEAQSHLASLAKQRFWWVSPTDKSDNRVLFDSQSKLLWGLLPPDPEELETHAILGRDFRTLTQAPDQWDKNKNNVNETTFREIPEGWQLVNNERTSIVASKSYFNVHENSYASLVSFDGCSFYTRREASPGNRGSCPGINRNIKNQLSSSSGTAILLERIGCENLPISTDYEDYLPRKTDFSHLQTLGFSHWQLPTAEELSALVKEDNPYRPTADNPRLQGASYWRIKQGNLIIGTDYQNKLVLTKSDTAFNARELLVNSAWQALSPLQIMQQLQQQGLTLHAADQTSQIAPTPLVQLLQNIDYRPARLPQLENADFNDVNKGIWEFWGMDEARLKQLNLIARDPIKDMRNDNVAIDFGTSSTVVAITNNGRPELLRIGTKDFYEAAKASHYENPTMLEFIDFNAFAQAWQSKAYRPDMNWDWLRAAHDAQNTFRDNQGDTSIVASMLPKMKQWALRQGQDYRVQLIDRKGQNYELPPLAPTNPVKGQLIQVSNQDAIDPIELYAWFLGMNINWRRRGVFTKYYMTFPVAYPKAVKDNILASFRRGMMRSMPESLAKQSAFQDKFALKELASEPAAYAASALSQLNIQPTTEGVAYAVFDFGGGTTDFDYGIYRTATAEEEDENGTEKVLEHIKAEGDKFLGGENLLENLAFLVFNANLDECREHKITFTKPLDAQPVPGTELLIDKSQAAQTNTIMLMSKLRSFWETGRYDNSQGLEIIDMLDHQGNKQRCQFNLSIDQLDQFLSQRIAQGIQAFLVGLKQAFGEQQPKQVELLLAGNSSRSKWVREFFGEAGEGEGFKALVQQIYPDQSPKFHLHLPLAIDEANPFKPTAKTGVALGLLKLCTGALMLKNRQATQGESNEAAFNHYVGRIRQGKFQVALSRGIAYQQWHELGPRNSEGAVYLKHTQSVLASTGDLNEEDTSLVEKRIDFVGDLTGQRAYVRAIDPNTIEVCSATSKEAIAQGDFTNVQTVILG